MKLLTFILLIPLLLLADIHTQNRRLSRTINLGNYLEGPEEGEWGNILVSEDFTRIALKGFTAVRVPIRWSNHLTDSNRIESDFLNRVKWVVNQAHSNNLTVIINDHHFDSLMTNPNKFEPVAESIWSQLAEHFKDYPNESLFFEPVNEPFSQLTYERWNSLHRRLISIIREKNQTRPILIATTDRGALSGLSNLSLPDDPNLIVTIHYYTPFEFTHQGTNWVEGSDEWLNTKWNSTFFEKRLIKRDIDAIAHWADSADVPIFIGEFGAYHKADLSSRELWTHYCSKLFESHKFSWAYWEYDAGFGLYNKPTDIWLENLTDTLLSNNTDVLDLDSSTISLGEEMLSPDDLSSGLSRWVHCVWGEKASATVSTNDSGLVHSVERTGDLFYNIQLLQDSISFEKKKMYILTAKLFSEDEITASLSIIRENNSALASSPDQLISREGTELELILKTSENISDLTVALNLGYSVGTVTISDISLHEIKTDIVKVTEKFPVKKSDLTISLKNRELVFSKPLSQPHTIKLFSLKGQLLMNQSITKGHTIKLPSELAPGWYGVIVTDDNRELLRSSFMLK